MMKERRTIARYRGRAIVVRLEGEHIHLRPLGKQWRASGVRVSLRDVFALGRRQQAAAKARDKQASKRAMRKLRRAMQNAEDGDGVDVLTEREVFMLAHLGREWRG